MGIKLKGLTLGTMGIDYEMLVFPHPKYILTASRREGRKIWCECPAISYLIEHPDGLVLWETGIATTFRAEWAPEWQELIDMSSVTPDVCLEARLKSLGLGPEDIRYVIQGHLHCDHAGGLRLFETSGTTVLCHEEEWKFVSHVETTDFFYSRPDWNFLGRTRPTTVYGDQEILKDLWLISLPGHTPGTMGLLARLDHTGWVMLTTDALYTHESYGPPAVGSPIVWDREKWAVSVEKIRKIGVSRNAFVLPGHDHTGIQHCAGGGRTASDRILSRSDLRVKRGASRLRAIRCCWTWPEPKACCARKRWRSMRRRWKPTFALAALVRRPPRCTRSGASLYARRPYGSCITS